MSFTTSFVGGLPFCFGTAGFTFVFFRSVAAFGVAGVVAAGPGPAGMSAVVALPPPPPPQPARAASAAIAIESVRLMIVGQGSESRRGGCLLGVADEVALA